MNDLMQEKPPFNRFQRLVSIGGFWIRFDAGAGKRRTGLEVDHAPVFICEPPMRYKDYDGSKLWWEVDLETPTTNDATRYGNRDVQLAYSKTKEQHKRWINQMIWERSEFNMPLVVYTIVKWWNATKREGLRGEKVSDIHSTGKTPHRKCPLYNAVMPATTPPRPFAHVAQIPMSPEEF